MAEFIHPKPKFADYGAGNGMNGMGKPVPAYRRQAGYEVCKVMGLETEAAWSATNSMAEQLERDEPYTAMWMATHHVDLTGAYRLMAVLLTAPKPRIRVTADIGTTP